MNRWLSTTWEANWRSFQYFNVYRFILAALLLVAGLMSLEVLQPFRSGSPRLFDAVSLFYVGLIGVGTVLCLRWPERFEQQLSAQMTLDVLAIVLLTYCAGGVNSGLGFFLLVSLTAASLVGRGRWVLLYAALATLSVLGMQAYGVWRQVFDPASMVQAGLLSAAFFATAILARLLGQRIMANEEIARRRGVALDNQIRISQQIIERMQDGVLVCAADGRILRLNPVAEQLLGVPHSNQGRLADYTLALAQAHAHWCTHPGAGVLAFANAQGRALQARFEPTASTDGESLVFVEDLGRIKQRAQELKLAALGRLTASIAHEIRNPLSAIGHAGELLAEECPGPLPERLLRILKDNVARLERIVRDVLELGRRDRLQAEAIDLSVFLPALIDEFVLAQGVPRDRLRLELAPLLVQPRLFFDPSHLRQVLFNLLVNACRHCRQETGSVFLCVTPGPGGKVELHVVDDGAGVEEALLGQVFEPFFTTHSQGTGLGLYIARELCEANGATLELLPATGCGHFVLSGRSEGVSSPTQHSNSA